MIQVEDCSWSDEAEKRLICQILSASLLPPGGVYFGLDAFGF